MPPQTAYLGFKTIGSEIGESVIWPGSSRRLISALKGLCCLARSGAAMQAQQIAERIGVSAPETSKVMQMLVWGGFVTSRRGLRGGFQLAVNPDQIRAGEVVNFFASKYQSTQDFDCPVMRVLEQYSAPWQDAFGRLTLAEIAAGRSRSKSLSPRKRA